MFEQIAQYFNFAIVYCSTYTPREEFLVFLRIVCNGYFYASQDFGEVVCYAISASFATFEPCKSHAVHRKVGNSGWPISSPWVGRTVTPEGIFRPVATAQEDSHVYAI